MPIFRVILLIIVATHFAVAILIGERKFVDYFTVSWLIEISTILVLPFLVWILYQSVKAIRRRVERPISFIYRKILADRTRFANALILLVSYAVVNRSYRAIKVSIPRLEPFYLDELYADLDRALFGVDPWLLTHSVIGPGGTVLLDIFYFLWVKIILLTFAFCAFSPDSKFQMQSCTTFFLIWIVLGNVLAVLMSAAGPCFYEAFYQDDRFVPLMTKLGEMDLIAPELQAYLLSVNGDEAIGSGISAMPSVHCAMTMFIVLLAYQKFGLGWQFALALAYHIIILVGSVHLGWHYAVDGLLSMILVPLLWWLVLISSRYLPDNSAEFVPSETSQTEPRIPHPRTAPSAHR